MVPVYTAQLSRIALYLFVLITPSRTESASSSSRSLLRIEHRRNRALFPNEEDVYTSVALNTGVGGCSGSQEATLDIYRGTTESSSGGSVTVLHIPGGAYMNLVEGTIDSAGSSYLAAGYTLAVLYYRLPRSATNQPWLVCSDSDEALDDLAAAIHVLRDNAEEFYVNPSAIVTAGFSAGGHLAALYATKCIGTSSCPNAMVLHFPFLEAGAQIFCTAIGDAFANNESYNSCFPTALVDNATPPTILYHASEDPKVSTQSMIDFSQSLSNSDVPYEYYEVLGGGHYLVPFDQVVDASGGVFTDGDDYSALVARSLDLTPTSCTRCDDVASDWMINNEQTCETGLWSIENKCSSDIFWTSEGYCRQSCCEAGRGYKGYNCCPRLEQCITCNNVPSPWMESNGRTCEDGTWFINNNCNTNVYWEDNIYCRQSCFRAGMGYDGDNCC